MIAEPPTARGRTTRARRTTVAITGFTPITITGPAAGDDRLKTADDPTGTTVLGMFNNCGGGYTPWGTILTCEENFNQYFANTDTCPDAAAKANHQAYGLSHRERPAAVGDPLPPVQHRRSRAS